MKTLGTVLIQTLLPTNLSQGGLGNPTNPFSMGALSLCSQLVGPAACYRSDTIGSTWTNPSTLAYNGTTTACGGLHGALFLHVAPDGTVWLPLTNVMSKAKQRPLSGGLSLD